MSTEQQTRPVMYRAVARHRVDADDRTKRRELLEGLKELVYELLEGGMTWGDLQIEAESAAIDWESDQEASTDE